MDWWNNKGEVLTCLHCDGTGTLAPFAMTFETYIDAGGVPDEFNRLVEAETEINCPICDGRGYRAR